jgi:hypothetical protein
MSIIYLVQRLPILLVLDLLKSIEENSQELLALAVKLPIKSPNHLVEQLSASHNTRLVLLYNLQNDEKKTVFVSEISDKKREALDGEVDDVIRLVLFAEQRNNLVDDDGNVFAEKGFEDFEKKSEAHESPFCLFGILCLQKFDEALEELLEMSVEFFA